jgi:two-component system chemotaxis sensor kinase CheA
MTDNDLEQISLSFLAETQEDLTIVEQALLRLEKSPDDRDEVATIFRKFHSLKGNASSLRLVRLGGFAHRVEDLLQSVRDGRQTVTKDLVSHLLRVVDELREMVPAALEGREELSASAEALLQRIDGGRLREAPTPVEPSGERDVDTLAEAPRTLRIDIGKFDSLLSLTSEIAIARGRLALAVERGGSPETSAAYRSMERLLNNLHSFVMKVRMVPIHPLLQQYARVVRDLALAQHNEAELVITDHGVEVDTSVVEQLKAPLTQLVRNAVCHGIEKAAVRKRLGKRPAGRIELHARHEAGGIVIEVRDDGAGLDRRRILARARELGIVAEDAAPSDREIDRLIFRQGLSTARDVTNTSGRGVGLDVVLRHLDTLGGSVDVQSQTDCGTAFTIRMPLTLAIIDGLLLQVDGDTFVLPMTGIVRCLDLSSTAATSLADGVATFNGQAVPFLRLRSVFDVPGTPPSREVIVVLQKGDEHFGIAADQLAGKAQIVVRPAGRFFKGLPAISGMAILGDGQVAPILNVAGILERHLSDSRPSPGESAYVAASEVHRDA